MVDVRRLKVNYVCSNSFHLWSGILAQQYTNWISVSAVQIIADSSLLECSLEWLLCVDHKMHACQEPINARVLFSLSIWKSLRTSVVTCDYWQGYLWLFTREDLKFGHVFGSCIKTVPLLRTCPLPHPPSSKTTLVLAVSRTEYGLERPQNFRHYQHSRTCIEEDSWRGVSAVFWTVDHWLTKYTADQGKCFKRDSNSYSLLLLYLVVMRLWTG